MTYPQLVLDRRLRKVHLGGCPGCGETKELSLEKGYCLSCWEDIEQVDREDQSFLRKMGSRTQVLDSNVTGG